MSSKLGFNKKTLTFTAAAIVAVVAVSLVWTSTAMASSAPAFTTVTANSASVTDKNTAGHMLSFNLTTLDNIPQNANGQGNYLYGKLIGYAWLGTTQVTNGPILFTAATIHRASGILDSIQNPNGWHVHTGTLTATEQCNIPNSLGGLHLAVSSITDPTGAGISIQGNTLSVSLAESSSNVNPENFNSGLPNGGAVGFSLQPNARALCVVSPPDA